MSNNTKKTASPGWNTVFDMALDELESRVAQTSTLMKQAFDLFPGLLVMTDDARPRLYLYRCASK